jgi:hypothetical protein
MSDLSSPFTSNWLDADAMDARAATFDRIKRNKGKKKKERKRTVKQVHRDNIDKIYREFLNGKNNWGWFLDKIVEYIMTLK